ncbi:MAG TPA: universal stress protein [Candidatus Bathyarchaeia archaeon]|nr:universal stress protein [Candidatus Bathyarchaeia archaeon]
MAKVEIGTRVVLKNILYLTDFSEPSEAALPFAESIAREYGAKVYAFHVMIPAAYAYTTPELTAAALEGQEDYAVANMLRVSSHLSGLLHETIIERGTGIWSPLEQAIREYGIDLVVVGTHGRTGAQRLLLGSVAEEVFRRSHVPVLTIGPGERRGAHRSARFRHVLFATDFTPESLAAAPYALSMAQENEAQLTLLHVMKEPQKKPYDKAMEDAISSALFQLHEIVPQPAESWCKPEAVVEFGNPAEQILKTTKERGADLIVLGVRAGKGVPGAATHLERATAHKVVVRAECPVLTVRG